MKILSIGSQYPFPLGAEIEEKTTEIEGVLVGFLPEHKKLNKIN